MYLYLYLQYSYFSFLFVLQSHFTACDEWCCLTSPSSYFDSTVSEVSLCYFMRTLLGREIKASVQSVRQQRAEQPQLPAFTHRQSAQLLLPPLLPGSQLNFSAKLALLDWIRERSSDLNLKLFAGLLPPLSPFSLTCWTVFVESSSRRGELTKGFFSAQGGLLWCECGRGEQTAHTLCRVRVRWFVRWVVRQTLRWPRRVSNPTAAQRPGRWFPPASVCKKVSSWSTVSPVCCRDQCEDF